MISATSAFITANNLKRRTPRYVLEIDGITTKFSTGPILDDAGSMVYLEDVSDCMQVPRGIASEIEPLYGRSSSGEFSIVLIDNDDEITDLIATPPGIGGLIATLKAGFDSIALDDYITVARGVIENFRLTPDLMGYELTISEPQILTNKPLFKTAATSLAVSLNASDSTAIVTDATDLETSGYVRIGNEIVAYTGKSGSGRQPFDQAWTGMCDADGSLVAVGMTDSAGPTTRCATSDDGGITWIPQTMPLGLWTAVAYGNGVVVAVGTGYVATSADKGRTWVSRTGSSVNHWRAIAYGAGLGSGAGRFVVVGTDNSANFTIMTSDDDGVTWTDRTPAGYGIDGIAWSPALQIFTCVSQNGAGGGGASSPDGITWTARTATGSAVCWDPTLALFVAVDGDDSTAHTSANGTTWSNHATPSPNGWVEVSSDGQGNLVAVGVTGDQRVMTSTNGSTWTLRDQSPDSTGQWSALAYDSASGNFAALSVNGVGRAMVSADLGVTWTTYSSKLTGLTRGVLGTVGASQSANAIVREVFRLGPAHPIDILLDILQDTGDVGLAIDASLIDTASLAAVKSDIGDDFQMEFRIDEPIDAKDFIETEILGPLGLYPIAQSGGFNVHRMADLGSPDDAITHDEIIASEDGKPVLGWDGDFSRSIVNAVIIQFDYNLGFDEFENAIEFTDDTSIGLYGRRPLLIKSKGFHASLFGTIDLITDMADRILSRYANGAPTVTARVFLQKLRIEPGDVVSVTSAVLPNPDTGGRGITTVPMEVLKREMCLDQGYVDLTLQWVAWAE